MSFYVCMNYYGGFDVVTKAVCRPNVCFKIKMILLIDNKLREKHLEDTKSSSAMLYKNHYHPLFYIFIHDV